LLAVILNYVSFVSEDIAASPGLTQADIMSRQR
jgi:hypothetical protein